jgi:AraC-like DNA-binding protein
MELTPISNGSDQPVQRVYLFESQQKTWSLVIQNFLSLLLDKISRINWIHTHYAEKILLDDIARDGQLSRSECCRYFKRILKKTPLNYVTDYRIQKSLILLPQSDSNVTDIAYQVGFNSTSYFIDKFRKSMNMTPLTYKKFKNS